MRAHTADLLATLLDELGEQGEVDVVAAVASRLPPAVFCWMVGCDVDAGPELAAWSSVALQAFSGDPAIMDDVTAAIRRLRAFADALIDEKMEHPGDDITSTLVAAVGIGTLERRDVSSLLTELLSASVDNTINSIAVAVWLVARHPEVWEALAAGAAPVEQVVEECARFEPAVRSTTVVAERDVELLGETIPAGTLVTLDLAAAHRDGAAYPEPDQFDVFRENGPPQLEFGIGRHFCLGAALARMEIQEVLRGVTARWNPPTLLPGVLERLASSGELDALPVAFRRRAA
jgi:cytochrome P450